MCCFILYLFVKCKSSLTFKIKALKVKVCLILVAVLMSNVYCDVLKATAHPSIDPQCQ